MKILRPFFVLPILATILLSFRNEISDAQKSSNFQAIASTFTKDTVPNTQLSGIVDSLKLNNEIVDASLEGPRVAVNVYSAMTKTIQYSDSLNNVLFIIDGQIKSKKDTEVIKPELIESIDVLKGKVAIALYGEKGKDGVIIIKTKNHPIEPKQQ